MTRAAAAAAYFFNSTLLTVALIERGVRMPAGLWRWVANAPATSEHLEQALAALTPSLKGKVLAFVSLSNEAEVQEFERSHP
jgi:hypothetical protein